VNKLHRYFIPVLILFLVASLSFAAKMPGSGGSGGGSGTVNSVTATSPLTSSGGTDPDIAIPDAKADGSTKGAGTFTAVDFDDSSGVIGLADSVLKSVITDSGTATGAAHGVTIEGAGIVTTSGTGDTVTITGTEVDGSTTNEINTITADDSNTTTALGITIEGGEGVDTSVSGNIVTVAGEDCTSANKGIGTFNTDNFLVSSGDVTIKDDGVILGTETTGNYAAGTAEAGAALTGDAAVDFFGAGVDAVTDATACTDIEGAGLSITTGTLNITAADESADTACYLAFFTGATGALGPKTGTNATINSTNGAVTFGVAGASEVQASLSLTGDADSDAADTDETMTFALTTNADPTQAEWEWTTTQTAGIKFNGSVESTGSFIIGSAAMSGTDLEKLDGITNGTGAANKCAVLDASLDLAMGTGDLSATLITAAGKVVANASLDVKNGATSSGVIAIYEDSTDGTNFASFQSPALAGNTVYTLPTTDGGAGEFLQSNGSGVLTWAAGGGGATAYDDIGDPDASGSIAFGAYTGTYTSATDGWGGMLIDCSLANPTSDTTLLSLRHVSDNASSAEYLKCINDYGSGADVVFETMYAGRTGIGREADGSMQLVVSDAVNVANAATIGLYCNYGFISSGTDIGILNFGGLDGDEDDAAQIISYASETWSAGNNGAELAFVTTPNTSDAGIERLRISNAGNVTLGSTTVDGGSVTLQDGAQTGDDTLIIAMSGDGAGDASLTTSDGHISLMPGSGNVGIGVAAPGEMLEVLGDASYIESNHTATDSFSGYKMSEAGTFTAIFQGIGSTFATANRQNDLEIWSVAGDLNLQKDGGKIGIGTVAPLSTVQIVSDLDGSADLGDWSEYQFTIVTGGTTGDTAGILLASSDDTYGGSAIVHTDTDTGGRGDLMFYTKQSASAVAPVEIMKLGSSGNITVTANVNPEADGTRDLGTETTAQWANVWADAVNGADYTYYNNFRTMELEKFAGYPSGIAITSPSINPDLGSINEKMDGKPLFAVCEEFLEYKGVRITAEQLKQLVEALEAK